MKRMRWCAGVLGLVGLVAVLWSCAGCQTLDPAGPYKGDKVLYAADGVISASYELIHAFVTWEKANRERLKERPEVTRYADYVRANAKQWVRTAIALRDAYAADPQKDPVALQRALGVLRAAAIEAAKYMTEGD